MTEFLTADITKYIGSSDDTKPMLVTNDVGSTFFETDTRDKYIWNGQSWKLFELGIKHISSDDICILLNKILKEQKKINLYFSLMNDVLLEDKDILD